ncbi:DMT family transporter [Tropicimonas sp. S265A]|uniref:DMT family transporter n=1 Tax=Tropicimonas sp. S265A TaxID=3415134 RepID=UPI003C7CA751
MSVEENRIKESAALIVAAMAIIGVIDNYVRFIAEDAGLWQFHAVRSVMVLVLVFGGGLVLGWRWRVVRPWAVLFRSSLVATSILLYFGALAVLPIATAGAGLFSSPIFVLLISVLVLRAPVGPWRIAAVLIGFCGMLLVLRPGGAGFEPVALIAILAGAFYASGTLATRRLCAQEEPHVLTAAFFAMVGLFGVIGLVVLGATDGPDFFRTGWQPITPRFLQLTALQAIGSLVAVACLVRAYQIADPSFTTIFEYTFLIFAGLWAWRVFGELPDAPALIGIALIVVAGVVILVRSRKPEP